MLDVTSSSSVADAAKQVRERHEHLDILINNAGILPEATDSVELEFADPAMFQETFDTNVVGPVTVIEAFLPLLRGSEAGRIVNVSSTMGSLVEQANPDSPYYAMVVPAYQSSKAALNSITIGLSKKLADTDIKVTSVCPGFVQTDLTPSTGSRRRGPRTKQRRSCSRRPPCPPTRRRAHSSTGTAQWPGNTSVRSGTPDARNLLCDRPHDPPQ